MNYDKYFFVLIPITITIHLIFFFYLKKQDQHMSYYQLYWPKKHYLLRIN